MATFYKMTETQLEKLAAIKNAHNILRDINEQDRIPKYLRYEHTNIWLHQKGLWEWQSALDNDMRNLLSEFEAPTDITYLAHHAGTRHGGFFRAIKWLEDAISGVVAPATTEQAAVPQLIKEPEMKNPSRPLSLKDVAEIVGKTERTVFTWVRDGKVKSRKITDGSYIIDLADLGLPKEVIGKLKKDSE